MDLVARKVDEAALKDFDFRVASKDLFDNDNYTDKGNVRLDPKLHGISIVDPETRKMPKMIEGNRLKVESLDGVATSWPNDETSAQDHTFTVPAGKAWKLFNWSTFNTTRTTLFHLLIGSTVLWNTSSAANYVSTGLWNWRLPAGTSLISRSVSFTAGDTRNTTLAYAEVDA